MQTHRLIYLSSVGHRASRSTLTAPKTVIVNPNRNTFRAGLIGLYLAVWLGLVQPGMAQINQPADPSRAKSDSSRGYWQVNTQAATRSTRVQFFGASHQLLYEEILPEKWVNLSRKNQKQFDKLLAQLVANQLLTDRIKTEPLPPTHIVTHRSHEPVETTADPGSPVVSTSYLINAYLNQAGKMRLIINNPERLRYIINIVDQLGRPLYEDRTNHDHYNRLLDLSNIPDETCQVMVQIDKKQYQYQIQRRETRFAFVLQPQLVVHPKPKRGEKVNADELPLVPVTTEL